LDTNRKLNRQKSVETESKKDTVSVLKKTDPDNFTKNTNASVPIHQDVLIKKNVLFKNKEISMVAQPQERNPKAAKFKLEDGLVTIAGDIVIGVPNTDHFPNQGWIEIPEFPLWNQAEVPFFIQPAVVNSDRIYQAFELFKDSPIHFVPLTDQTDAVVFENKPGVCKSYVGKVGGMQPIWIGSECSPADIAHELMHVLGFIHEQNRTDRDHFVEILWDNIKEENKYNFEMLPDSLMKLSGLTVFDFNSLMIYTPTSFAKTNGLITIKAKKNKQILPGSVLSPFDLERLNKFYNY
jgi:hypothetical protein